MNLGFCEILSLILVVSKLTHTIAWSWFWVLSPVLLSWGFILGAIIGTFVVALFVTY